MHFLQRITKILFFGLSAIWAQASLPILPGIFQTEAYLPRLANKKVGLVINPTSVFEKTHLLDSLLRLGVRVEKIFALEHGIRGQASAGQTIQDTIDEKTGLPIFSLYGKNKKPPLAYFEDIDVVIFDIQDVGVRFYTYISSLHYILETSLQTQTPLIVLDRPNPNIFYVDGPILK